MERLAILDHSSHPLFIEDVTEEMLAPYNGDEQAYINDNYTLEGDYSWDYIVDAQMVLENGDVTEIDFDNIKDI